MSERINNYNPREEIDHYLAIINKKGHKYQQESTLKEEGVRATDFRGTYEASGSRKLISLSKIDVNDKPFTYMIGINHDSPDQAILSLAADGAIIAKPKGAEEPREATRDELQEFAEILGGTTWQTNDKERDRRVLRDGAIINLGALSLLGLGAKELLVDKNFSSSAALFAISTGAFKLGSWVMSKHDQQSKNR